MKTTRRLVLIAFALSIGFLAAHWSPAQSSNRPASKGPITGANNPAIEQLNALVSYLEANKQTNALKLFYDYSNASLALQHSADIGATLHTLMALREGRTNDAMELLEVKLDHDINDFAGSFKELPEEQREWLGLHALTDARWYRNKYPHKHRFQDVDEGVADAFKILDDKTAK
jgi:hypothetical protein